MKFINEFGKYVAFAGFREVRISDVDFFIKEVRSKLDSRVVYQFFNANFVATWKHLFFAVLNALKAFESGSNISRSLAIEILLYASAQRQIQKAMDLIGITPKTTEIAVLVMG
ncbi:MAG: KEOPS complex subunit Cgi121, partial [Candidatus Bathyarchaeia archaeon]